MIVHAVRVQSVPCSWYFFMCVGSRQRLCFRIQPSFLNSRNSWFRELRFGYLRCFNTTFYLLIIVNSCDTAQLCITYFRLRLTTLLFVVLFPRAFRYVWREAWIKKGKGGMRTPSIYTLHIWLCSAEGLKGAPKYKGKWWWWSKGSNDDQREVMIFWQKGQRGT